MNNILVLNYGLGNPSPISNMLQYSNIQHVLDNDPNLIKKFKKIIIPGIGYFYNSIKYMNSTGILKKRIYK